MRRVLHISALFLGICSSFVWPGNAVGATGPQAGATAAAQTPGGPTGSPFRIPDVVSRPIRPFETVLKEHLENPSDGPLCVELALHYVMRKDARKATECIECALQTEPESADMHYVAGFLYGSLVPPSMADPAIGSALEFAKAAQLHMDRALVLKPDFGDAAMAKAGLLIVQVFQERDPARQGDLRRQLDDLRRQFPALTTADSQAGPPAGARRDGASPFPSAPNAVRVGGDIRPPTKVVDVKPVYPAEALQARVQGVVILQVLIGEAGDVQDAKVVRSIPLLDQAAVDAVRQWTFTQTLVDGAPKPVILTITVGFSLARRVRGEEACD